MMETALWGKFKRMYLLDHYLLSLTLFSSLLYDIASTSSKNNSCSPLEVGDLIYSLNNIKLSEVENANSKLPSSFWLSCEVCTRLYTYHHLYNSRQQCWHTHLPKKQFPKKTQFPKTFSIVNCFLCKKILAWNWKLHLQTNGNISPTKNSLPANSLPNEVTD